MRKYYIVDIADVSIANRDEILAVPGNNIEILSGDRYLIKGTVKPPQLIAIEIALSKTFDEKLYEDIKTEQTTRLEL